MLLHAFLFALCCWHGINTLHIPNPEPHYLNWRKSPGTQEINNCSLSQDLKDEIQSYQNVVNQIISYVTNGEYKGQTYSTLATLVDTFGARMTGSAALENAIDFMLNWSANEGLDNMYTEDVLVPHWKRFVD
ncbi:hypothetical protein SK128_013770 [Halocaridina rubra]|uniref:Uncharacterized protein n=1 Tax=Halocaridina rubra TaxID=373956 RepID=A0AAN8WNV0_HALRR